MANEELIKQVSQIQRKLANVSIEIAKRYLKEAFHLTPQRFSLNDITAVLRQYFPTHKITHKDYYYYLLPWWQWKDLIEVDWIDKKKQIEDRYDCDNKSDAFSSNMSFYFDINSAGQAYGKLYQGTDKFLDYHYWNVIITSNKEIYFLETGNDKWTKYEGGMLLIGGNLYEPINFVFG